MIIIKGLEFRKVLRENKTEDQNIRISWLVASHMHTHPHTGETLHHVMEVFGISFLLIEEVTSQLNHKAKVAERRLGKSGPAMTDSNAPGN